MRCPRCGRENRRDAIVCWKCRASLAPSHEPALPTRRIPKHEKVERQIPYKAIGMILGAILLFSIVGGAVYYVPKLLSSDSGTPTPTPEPTTSEGEIKQGETFLKINVEAKEDYLVVTGNTNLSEGTEIMLTMLDPSGKEKAKKKLTVIKGSFTHNFGPFLFTVYPGKYSVTAKEYRGQLQAEATIFFSGNVEPYQAPQNQGVLSFKEMTAAEGLKLAKSQNKLLLILFVDYTPQVVIEGKTQNPSQYLEKTALDDPEVRGVLNLYFIAMKINATENKELAQPYEVSLFPSIRAFNGEGILIGSINGYNSPETLKKKLLAFTQTTPYGKA